MSKLYIPYYRVSTKKQGATGYGLEAQKSTVHEYVERKGGKILQEFTEVESGKNNERPILQEATSHCVITGAILVVAKLDRLSRDIGFIDKIQKSHTQFEICDFPEANSFTISIFAALAQYERQLICSRTKAGLAAAKAKGVILGKTANLNRCEESFEKGRIKGGEVKRKQADEYVDHLRPVLETLHKEGLNLTQIAEKLNDRGIRTPSKILGGWKAQSVKNALKRLEARP